MRLSPALILAAICLSPAPGQQRETPVDWLTALQSIEARLRNTSAPEQEVEAIRLETRRLHRRIEPASVAADIGAPPADAGREALLDYVTRLRGVLEELERSRPGGAFHLGRVEVNVSAEAQQVATAVTVDENDYRRRNAQVVPDALATVPGVSVQRIGPRNERGVFVRGFDIRQVPLYVDGIPVYVPYDGYVDLDRFLVSDIGEIQVAKGFTSPLYGPNAIGGAINLISKAPAQPFNLDLGSGYASGGQVHGFANAGSRWRRFWLQGGFSYLTSDSFPLAGGFRPTPVQPAGRRANAWQTDHKTRVRAAWTPNQSDQYTFTYANQQGKKGNPPYAGLDAGVQLRFWQWPEWDKESFYFIANKGMGESTYLRARLYYDKFDNLLRAFDDSSYTAQTRPSSFNSPFDDDTYGGILELGSSALARQTVKGSFYFKDDTHREGNIGQPTRSFRDQTFSLGLEDTVQISARTSAILGLSADRLQVLNAEDFRAGQVLPFPLDDLWALNGQAGLFHAVSDSGRFRATFARKTRLPTIKDRYSYRMGLAVPNPGLMEEQSSNWEVGYSQLVGRSTYLEAALFASRVRGSIQRFFLQPNLWQWRNLGRARFLGSEFGLRTSPVASVTWTANYTYLTRKNLFDPGLIMVDTPRHKTYSAMVWQPARNLTLMADIHYEAGRFHQNEAGRFLRSSRFVNVGLGGTLRLSRAAELQTGIGNLFDRNYFLVDGYPEAGRNGYVNLRYRF